MSISKRIFYTLGAIVLACAVCGGVAIYSVERLGALTGGMIDGAMRATNSAQAAKTNFLLAKQDLFRARIAPGSVDVAAFDAKIATVRTELTVLTEATRSSQSPALIDEIKTLLSSWAEDARREIETRDAVGDVSDDALNGRSKTIVKDFDELVRAETEYAYEDKAAAEATILRTEIEIAAITLAALIIGFFGWRSLKRCLSDRLGAFSHSMKEIETGHLNVTIAGLERRDEIGAMAQALETFRVQARRQIAVKAGVDASTSAFLVLDQNGAKIACNPAFETLLKTIALPFETDAAGARSFAAFAEAVAAAERAGSIQRKNDGSQAIEACFGGRIIECKRTHFGDAENGTLGIAFEIGDVTQVRELEKEVVDVIEGVEAGKFGRRISAIDGLGFTSFVAQGLNRQMDAIEAFMGELDQALVVIADGDLTRGMRGAFVGDFEAAREGFNANIDRMRRTLSEVDDAARRVRDEADPIAAAARDLATRAEAQAATLQETNATMQEMTSSIRDSAASADQVAALSAETTERAEAGGVVVDDTIAAMSRIEESAAKITDIIGVIDGIAFQTNLLALNAAVEAARAGEAGKGFAVVASEVRTLAQRSSEAASDIRDLISASAEHVSDGVRLVHQTGDALRSLVEAARNVAGTISEMSESQREQATGAAEISNAVRHLDDITQRNAAMADQSAAAAKSLTDASVRLFDRLSRFKTGAPHLAEAAEVELERMAG
ncbi:MAG: methyl-accepting chemotaxis protein [Pseudomonadota bacterium]